MNQQTNSQANLLLEYGIALYDKNQLDLALVNFEKFLLENPTHINALYYKGLCAHGLGKISLALSCFEKVLALDADHTDAAIALSALYNDLGNYAKGRLIFENAMKKVKVNRQSGEKDPYINRKFALKHFELGEMYLGHERFDEALAQFQQVIVLDPQYLEGRIRLAKTYAKKGLMAKAILELKTLKNEHPDFYPARMALGILYFGLGNILEAQNEWQKILDMCPNHKAAYDYLKLSMNASEVKI